MEQAPWMIDVLSEYGPQAVVVVVPTVIVCVAVLVAWALERWRARKPFKPIVRVSTGCDPPDAGRSDSVDVDRTDFLDHMRC